MLISDSIYGYDRSYLDGSVITGPLVLAQQFAKRITVASGALFWDLNTDNAYAYLMQKFSPQDLRILETSTTNLFFGDPRMTVKVTCSLTNQVLTYTGVITVTSNPAPIIVTYIPATNTLQVQAEGSNAS